MFEAYARSNDTKHEYKKYHVIKVIPDDAVLAVVEEYECKYKVVRGSDRIQWVTIDTREDMEIHLLE